MSDPTDPTDPTGDQPGAVTLPPTSLRYKALVVLAGLLALGAFALAVTRTNTSEDEPVRVASRPDVVEHLVPFNGAQVPRQAELGVDLAPGYEGTLVVNGIEIPADQQRLVPEQNQVFFSPGEGKVIDKLPAGGTCVVAIAWKSAVGRGPADEAFRWCFEVV